MTKLQIQIKQLLARASYQRKNNHPVRCAKLEARANYLKAKVAKSNEL